VASSSSPAPEFEAWATRFLRPWPRARYRLPTRQVARALLGTELVRRHGNRFEAVRIVETEAYLRGDAANHAFRGPTPRNRSMFAAPGTLYVYRIHQVHCANVVTRPGEAVLLRSAEPRTVGLGETRGPGRLCRALKITRDDDGHDLVSGSLRILLSSTPTGRILRGPRVGIRLNADAVLRYGLEGSPWVSSPRIQVRPRASKISGALPS
jgi:DNA-3-methyladenine glycosylase